MKEVTFSAFDASKYLDSQEAMNDYLAIALEDGDTKTVQVTIKRRQPVLCGYHENHESPRTQNNSRYTKCLDTCWNHIINKPNTPLLSPSGLYAPAVHQVE